MQFNAITESNRETVYIAAGGQTEFVVPFKFQQDEDLEFGVFDGDGTFETLVLTQDYSVSGAEEDAGGTITLASVSLSCTAGAKRVINVGTAIADENASGAANNDVAEMQGMYQITANGSVIQSFDGIGLNGSTTLHAYHTGDTSSRSGSVTFAGAIWTIRERRRYRKAARTALNHIEDVEAELLP